MNNYYYCSEFLFETDSHLFRETDILHVLGNLLLCPQLNTADIECEGLYFIHLFSTLSAKQNNTNKSLSMEMFTQ